jgi:histidine triad (HIT) family protein
MFGDDPRVCTFCGIAAGDRPAEVIFEDEQVMAFMDALPMTRGHMLLIPKRHVRDLYTLEHADAAPLLMTASRLSRRIIGALGAQGVNVLNNNGAAADQSQFHVHFHLIPRYGNDRLLHPYERRFGHWPEIREVASELRAWSEPT